MQIDNGDTWTWAWNQLPGRVPFNGPMVTVLKAEGPPSKWNTPFIGKQGQVRHIDKTGPGLILEFTDPDVPFRFYQTTWLHTDLSADQRYALRNQMFPVQEGIP